MAKQENTMETSMINTQGIRHHRNPGRPMKIGKFVSGPTLPGGIGIYAGRCGDCNAKVLIPPDAASTLADMFYTQRRSLRYRIVSYLLGKH